MRIGADTKLWVVVDPSGDANLDDILFETTLAGLERQFRGGLTCDANPVIFLDREDAYTHAKARTEAWNRYWEEARALEAQQEEARLRYEAEIEGLP